jgi:hypothetical protein
MWRGSIGGGRKQQVPFGCAQVRLSPVFNGLGMTRLFIERRIGRTTTTRREEQASE